MLALLRFRGELSRKVRQERMTMDGILQGIRSAVAEAREKVPLVPSVTNTVTINFVANAQLAVGGSAAMVYLPDEGRSMAEVGAAMYINMGTILPIYEETLPETARVLHEQGKPWVLDPVGIGIGSLRERILCSFMQYKPAIIRCNASEAIALANLWRLESGREKDGVRGVDATDSVLEARRAAVALARWTGGAVAVSGERDLITDGRTTAFSTGGSALMPKITGTGCSLGGVAAVYAAVASPFLAAMTASAIYNLAGQRAEEKAKGPGSFQVQFLDELYLATPEDVAGNPLELEEEIG